MDYIGTLSFLLYLSFIRSKYEFVIHGFWFTNLVIPDPLLDVPVQGNTCVLAA